MDRTVLLVAGEASGDLHGAELIRAMKKSDPTLRFAGIGGMHLRAEGMQILVDTASVATMGLVETFGTLGRLLRAYRALVRFMREQRPALLMLIDYPEFNLMLAKRARKLGIPVFYFISPQVWAWRSGRVRKIARRVDRLGVVFPFEEALYNTDGRDLAKFVGHPLLDIVAPTRSAEETRARYGFAPDKPLLAVLPGSRKKEIGLLLGAAHEAALQLREHGWQAVLALAQTLSPEDLQQALSGRELQIPAIREDTYNLVHAADAALVASGTATLETALLGKPMVIMYKVSPLTYALARRLIRIDMIGMPNIILGRRVFPEIIQNEVTAERLAEALVDVYAQRKELTAMLNELRSKLGEPGATTRAARLALDLIQ